MNAVQNINIGMAVVCSKYVHWGMTQCKSEI